jgi:hypothetical protein
MEQEFPKTKFDSLMKKKMPTKDFFMKVFQNTQRYTDNMRKKEQEKLGEPTREYEIGIFVYVSN